MLSRITAVSAVVFWPGVEKSKKNSLLIRWLKRHGRDAHDTGQHREKTDASAFRFRFLPRLPFLPIIPGRKMQYMRKASSTLNARTLSLLLAILLLAWLGVRSLESVAAAHDSQNSDVVPDAVDINVDITIDDRGEPVGHVVNVASGDVGVIAKAVADEYPRQLATGTEAGKIQVVIRPTRRVKYQYVIKLYQAVLDTGLTRVALAHTEK